MSLDFDVFAVDPKPIPSAVPGFDEAVGPATWPPSTSTLISDDGSALLVDCLITEPEARKLAAWIQSRDRAPAYVYVTHPHADHFLGLPEILAAFPEARLELRYARAVLATDPGIAAACFEDALSADLARWPFDRARLLLAYGRWLRRERRIAGSRDPLRAARDIFDTLGCAAWADQARRELRASGESSRRRDLSPRDELTAQELQIAQLAAEGLSNREIGQKLFVSPRTVSTHLYRIYPKLGISARSQLAVALSETP